MLVWSGDLVVRSYLRLRLGINNMNFSQLVNLDQFVILFIFWLRQVGGVQTDLWSFLDSTASTMIPSLNKCFRELPSTSISFSLGSMPASLLRTCFK